MKRWGKICLAAVWLSAWLPWQTSFASPAAGARVHPHILLIWLEGVPLDALEMPGAGTIHTLVQDGAVGWITVPRGPDTAAAAGMATGETVNGAPSYAAPFERDEAVPDAAGPFHASAQDLYRRHTGVSASGRILLPGWPEWYALYPQSGRLGDLLHQAGWKTAFVGNGDLGKQRFDPGVLLAADRQGSVDTGVVGVSLLHQDPTAPFGITGSLPALRKAFREAYHQAGWIVLEPGDSERLLHYRDFLDVSAQAARQRMVVEDLNRLLQDIVPQLAKGDRVLMVSVPDMTEQQCPLGWGLLFEKGVHSGGLLTSSTTKRNGLVAYYDIVPTVASWLGVHVPSLGTPVRVTAEIPDRVNRLDRYLKERNAVETLRGPAVKTFVYTVMLLLVLEILLKRFRKHVPGIWADSCLLASLLVPLGFLLLPAGIVRPVLYGLLLAAVWAVAATVLALGRVPVNASATRWYVAAVLTMTLWIIVMDTWNGSFWMERSVLGFDPALGARYYGIGNEYMGVLLGCTVMVSLFLLSGDGRVGQRLSWLLFAGVVIVLGAPRLGANAGGALAAGIGFAFVAWKQAGSQVRKKYHAAAAVIFAAAASLGVVVWLNIAAPGIEQTHIGRAAGLLLDGQIQGLGAMVVRKVAVNYRLSTTSVWGEMFFLLLLVVWWRMRSIPEDTIWKRGALAVSVTAFAAYACNDSGVVAAALCLLYATIPLVVCGSPEEKDRKHLVLWKDVLY
jgi:hypothetical protein